MSIVTKIAWVLLLVGGLNWGAIGFFNMDLAKEAFGVMSDIPRYLYAAVGISTLWVLIMGFRK